MTQDGSPDDAEGSASEPQLVAASVLGLVLREFFDLQSIYGLVIGGVLMIIAGLSTLLVDKAAEPA